MDYYDIKPYTPVASLTDQPNSCSYSIYDVAPVVGMAESFIRKVVGKRDFLTEEMLIDLLNQDAFSETFVPRSKVLSYLRSMKKCASPVGLSPNALYKGDAVDLIDQLQDKSIQCVVTSTPYWAMRIYDVLVALCVAH